MPGPKVDFSVLNRELWLLALILTREAGKLSFTVFSEGVSTLPQMLILSVRVISCVSTGKSEQRGANESLRTRAVYVFAPV